MQQRNPQNGNPAEVVKVTDLLADLCTELAMLFKSISRVATTCLGLKEHLVTSPTPELPTTTINPSNHNLESKERYTGEDKGWNNQSRVKEVKCKE